MKDNKRHPHSYKSKSDVYNKAMRRAKKEKGNLSNLIENVVTCYAYGLEIRAIKFGEEKGVSRALDIFSMDNAVTLDSIKQIK